jgi:hypothetical protein
MRTLGLIEPQLLIVAALSRHDAVLAWAQARLQEVFGPLCCLGPTIAFNHTQYYKRTMGPGLKKQLLAFARLVEYDQLAAVKRRTMELEQDVRETGSFAEARPLNLDPGFLSLGKFVLATTKDQAHRIYLHGGIFAEVTLRYHHGAFEPQPWTYPDWRLPEVLEFLQQARVAYGLLRADLPPPVEELPPLLIPYTLKAHGEPGAHEEVL